MAVSESRFRTSALTGTTTLPVSRNSRAKVTRAITAAASGRLPNSDALVSTSWADGPVTWTPHGAGRGRRRGGGQVAEEGRLGVDRLGRGAGDLDTERGREVADGRDQVLAGRGVGLDRGHHRQPGAAGGGEAPT